MLPLIRGRTGDPSSGQQDLQEAPPTETKLVENFKSDIAPNAPVWKKYVDETDRYDKDLVEGWNNSLDVLLIFAALFSAISAAFVLESTQDLKPDYAENSAQTLSAILLAMSAGSPTNTSGIISKDQSKFSPSTTTVTVNILWFMSLSLSVAVALIAIVAKDWCYQFMSGRTGQHILQGRRRQLRWEGIEKWKMQGMLNVLPLMMHAALLLFAVGLSLYLWDINPRVALPVVVTTIIVGLFYIVTLCLPLFFRYCPFTTGFVKLFLPYWYTIAGPVLKPALQVSGWLIALLMVTRAVVKSCYEWISTKPYKSVDGSSKLSLRHWVTQIPFRSFWDDSQQWVDDRIQSISDTFTTDRSHLDGQDTPMDEVTSSMLGWMITQCEDPNSVDIALGALVSVKPWLPRDLLVRCGAFEATVARLSTSIAAWEDSWDVAEEDEHKLKQNVVLQSQSLSVMSHMDTAKITEEYLGIIHRLWRILDRCWDIDQDYSLALKELGNLSLHLGYEWEHPIMMREQVDRQWSLLSMVISKKPGVTGLSSADICHLIDGIAKSYLYQPNQSPNPLLDLLAMSEHKSNRQLCRMIGVALAVACVTNHNYPGFDSVPDWDSRRKRARALYIELTTIAPTVRNRWYDYEQLMHFGLVGALLTEPESEWRLNPESIVDLILDVDVYELSSNDYPYLGLPQDPLTTAIGWLLGTTHATPLSRSQTNPPLEHNESFAIDMNDHNDGSASRAGIIDSKTSSPRPAMERLYDPSYLAHAKQIVRLAQLCSDDTVIFRTGPILQKISETGLHKQLHKAISSENEDIIPYCMSFIWVFTRSLLRIQDDIFRLKGLDVPPIIESFRPGGNLPEDVGGMGYTESWIRKLEAACERDPQNVLNSKVLNEMIDYYREDQHQDLRPSAEGGPDAETSRTWLEILTDLRQNARLGRMTQVQAQTQSEEHGNEEGEETRLDIEYESIDESAGRRKVEERPRLDQSPPEAHE